MGVVDFGRGVGCRRGENAGKPERFNIDNVDHRSTDTLFIILDDERVRADLDREGPADRDRGCINTEGLLLTVRTNEPRKGT